MPPGLIVPEQELGWDGSLMNCKSPGQVVGTGSGDKGSKGPRKTGPLMSVARLSPDPARVLRVHGLPLLTAEGLAEFVEILHGTVYSPFAG